MKNFKLSRLFAAAVLVACLAFTGCKPVEDATQAIIKTQVLTQNTYATLLSGNWRSQYNDGYTIGGGLMIYDDGGYGFGWTATNHGGHVGWITSTPDKYVNWFPGNSAGHGSHCRWKYVRYCRRQGRT